ncbi:TetR/AcrR family transcriptional regulator [Oenococcus sicerae]|uniref:TetR/AcrR family transcriptional regulator n=1 Tax=Oenococcus sicerae TaxID=2203724 RepID=A0AAJ1VNP6_9LACO|nr:TetR/AcrR family transcriptional regulator [Oenococcus sicerae]MDN6900439.1 TetR/AcrR family transcriptional regulator [Oenococcus sicerae]QAS69541.1 TetR/AcrR family transcriptional regulator [Oenococcus sicerae]
MPKETFYNLSEEKRQRIIKAAGKEFLRVPLTEAKIANIVTTAHIPRGSFYQYFDGLDDLYHYFFEIKLRGFQENFREEVVKNKGDLIETWRQIAKHILEHVTKSKNAGLFQNAVLGLNNRGNQNIVEDLAILYHKKSQLSEEYEDVDFSLFKQENSIEDIEILRRIISGIIVQSATIYFAKKGTDEAVDLSQIMDQVNKQIDWLKYGTYKEKTHD